MWECMDRGGAIVKVGNDYWVDMLTPKAIYKYGEVVKGEVVNGVGYLASIEK